MRRNWTTEEEERLVDLAGKFPMSTVALKMGRTTHSIWQKASSMKIKQQYRDDWFTKDDVARIMGVSLKTVQHWIDSGELKASHHHGRKPIPNSGTCAWHIEAKDIRKFLTKYPTELQDKKTDIPQLIYILTGGN